MRIHNFAFLAALVFAGPVMADSNLNSPTTSAVNELGTAKVTEIKFPEGQANVSRDKLTEIAKAVSLAKGAGEIKEVKIISWADREYPAKGASIPNSSVNLAERRAEFLKKYVKDELKVGSVNTFNMAKRPNAVQEFLGTPTAEVKDAMEHTGAAPTNKEDTGFLGLKGKASTAMILVYTK